MKTTTTNPAIWIFCVLLSINLQSQSWDRQGIGLLPVDYGVRSISVVDENIVWAVAGDVSSNILPHDHIIKVIKTVDGGTTWENFDVEEAMGRGSIDIAALDANTAFITTFSSEINGVFKTEDGGDTWVEKAQLIAGGGWIRFFNAEDGVLLNRQFMAATNDGGNTWEGVPSPPFSGGAEQVRFYAPNNACVVVGDWIWFGTSIGRVFRSKDKGKTWEAFNTSLGDEAQIVSVAFRDTLNGITLDVSTFIPTFSRTNDGGETWTTIESQPEIPLINISYVPGTDSTLVGTSGGRGFFPQEISAYSGDFGRNWEVVDDTIEFTAIQFAGPDAGWAASEQITAADQAAMYKWVGDVFVNTRDANPVRKFEVFPNPFLNIVNISSPDDRMISYRLFTSTGRLIQSGRIDAPQSRLNLKALTPGIYLLGLISDDGAVATKKIIKSN